MKTRSEIINIGKMPASIFTNFRKSLFPLLLSLFLFFAINSCQSTPSDKRLRLITHNVWNGFTEAPEQKASWIDWLNDKQPDVLALQELNGYSPEKLREEAHQWGHTYSALLKQEGFPTGITSKFPLEDVQRTLDGFHHGLLRARIRGVYFYVIHLHPSNWKTRRREVELLLQDINALPADAHVVLAGDFNALSSADSIYYTEGNLKEFFYKRDQEINENNLKNGALDYEVINKITNHRFIDTELDWRPEGYQFTGSFPTAVEKTGNHGDYRRLDYVFVSPSLYPHVSVSRIIVNDQTMFFSDHLPILVDFEGLERRSEIDSYK